MGTAGRFVELFGVEPEVSVRSPGRVNLLGEHTDYTGGMVLPLAIDRHVEVLASRRRDGLMKIEAPHVGGSAELRADGIPQRQRDGRLNYLLGMVAELWPSGDLRGGFNLLVNGNLPMGAGLASSAALTVATAYALSSLFELGARDRDLILAAQRAEHRYAGVQCGIMDQAAAALSLRGHALLLDCRTMEMKAVPFKEADLVVAVCHSGVKHALAESGYNRRVQECAEALERIRRSRPTLACLGELEPSDLPEGLPATLARRCEHVVRENERVRAGAAALEAGDVVSFGRLMFASHDSLRDKYEVSCTELDTLVEAARGIALGAKMTGAGFGGAIVCLVQESRLEKFERKMRGAHPKVEITLCRSADGARASLSAGRTR